MKAMTENALLYSLAVLLVTSPSALWIWEENPTIGLLLFAVSLMGLYFMYVNELRSSSLALVTLLAIIVSAVSNLPLWDAFVLWAWSIGIVCGLILFVDWSTNKLSP